MPTASQLVVVQGAVMERASWMTRVNNDLSAIGCETVSAAQGFKGDFSHQISDDTIDGIRGESVKMREETRSLMRLY
jgi:hypothetical protein